MMKLTRTTRRCSIATACRPPAKRFLRSTHIGTTALFSEIRLMRTTQQHTNASVPDEWPGIGDFEAVIHDVVPVPGYGINKTTNEFCKTFAQSIAIASRRKELSERFT